MWHRTALPINGDLVAPAGTETLTVINPATEQVVGRAPVATATDVDRAVAAAHAAFTSGPWPRMSQAERADLLDRLADELATRAEDLTQVITASTGLTVENVRRVHVALPQYILRYLAGCLRSAPLEEDRRGIGRSFTVRRAPLGVVGAIVPWNIPLLGSVAKLGAAWAAGCTTVLKPSPETPLDAYLLAEAAAAAGMPPGVLNVVPGGAQTGVRLVEHPLVAKITFTGSTATGRRIAATCAGALKPYALELGGNAAAVVLDDAPIGSTAAGITKAALVLNNGEMCIAQSRVVVPRHRAAELTDALVAAAQSLRVGDPHDTASQLGPLVTDSHRARVRGLIDIGVAEGAKLLTGGTPPSATDRGWYLAPTVLGDVDNGMRVAREEIFGPVLTVIAADTEQDAIAIANDTEYGLSSSVWSADPERATQVGRQLQAGSVFVNDSIGLDPAAPFGGWKDSGVGREGGPEGIEEYLQTQALFTPPHV